MYFTIRDFLPITCQPSSIINQYWGPPWIISRESGCGLQEQLDSGQYVGHPDFQIGLEDWRNTSAPGSFYWAPGSGTPGLLNPLQTKPMALDGRGKFIPLDMMWAISPLVQSNLMEDESTGLSKTKYCNQNRCGVPYQDYDPSWPHVNPSYTQYKLAALANSSSYYVWYRDHPNYNKRVGVILNLNMTIVNGQEVYVYDSLNEPSKSFHPLDQFLVIDPSAVFPLTPNQEIAVGGGHKFWFTSECHTFFEYNPGQTFSFQGDDDFLAFINNQLVVDLSGMHNAYESELILDLVAEQLGLIPGEVYSLDIFHAERRMVGSNFKMTTSLVSGCTILRAGDIAFQYDALLGWSNVKFVGSFIDPTTNFINLVTPGSSGLVGYAFQAYEQNLAQGFESNFAFRVLGINEGMNYPEGFAFVFHRDPLGITNMNGGSSGNLGFKNFQNSVAIVFDLCANRPSPVCSKREVRMYTAFNGTRNSVKMLKLNQTLLYSSFFDEQAEHRVRIVSYGRPSWLEVYLNESLFLSLKNFSIIQNLGGKDAWMGFTASTGEISTHTASIAITRWSLKTVNIAPQFTNIIGPINDLTLVANGKDSVSVRIMTRDACNKSVSAGGYASWGKGYLFDTSVARLRRLNSNHNITMIYGKVIDNLNGTYDFIFTTTFIGQFSAVLFFGPDCNKTNSDITQVLSPNSCWNLAIENFVTSVPPKNHPDPTYEINTYPWNVVSGVLGGLFGTIFCFCFILVLLLKSRNRWRREKVYVVPGQLALLDRDVDFTVHPLSAKLNETSGKLQISCTELLKLKSQERPSVDTTELRNQNEEIKEHVKVIKQRKQINEQLEITESTLEDIPILKKNRFQPKPQLIGGSEGTRRIENDDLDSIAIFLKHPKSCFVVDISQRDVDMILNLVKQNQNSCVGGDLFGTFYDKSSGNCSVMHATGPGGNASQSSSMFEQDPQFTAQVKNFLKRKYPIVNHLGKWISFHKFQNPMENAIRNTWNEAKQSDRYVLLIVHIRIKVDCETKKQQKQVIVSPILFEMESAKKHKFGEMRIFIDNSQNEHESQYRHQEIEKIRNASLSKEKLNQTVTVPYSSVSFKGSTSYT